jgi:hypothetical protein
MLRSKWWNNKGSYPYASFSLHKDTTPPQPNHTVTHIEPEQYNTWNNSTNKSQAPEDGCTNIRNMLSSKWWNNKASDIKLVYLYSSNKRIFVSPSDFLVNVSRRDCSHGTMCKSALLKVRVKVTQSLTKYRAISLWCSSGLFSLLGLFTSGGGTPCTLK